MPEISKRCPTELEVVAASSRLLRRVQEMNQDMQQVEVDKALAIKLTGTKPECKDAPSLKRINSACAIKKNLVSSGGSFMSAATRYARETTLHTKKVVAIQHEIRKLEGEVNLKAVGLKMKSTRVSRLEAQLVTDHPDYAEENVTNLETEIRKMKADIENTIQTLEILTIENNIRIDKLKVELDVVMKEFEEYVIGFNEQNNAVDVEKEPNENEIRMEDENTVPLPILTTLDEGSGRGLVETPIQENIQVLTVMDNNKSTLTKKERWNQEEIEIQNFIEQKNKPDTEIAVMNFRETVTRKGFIRSQVPWFTEREFLSDNLEAENVRLQKRTVQRLLKRTKEHDYHQILENGLKRFISKGLKKLKVGDSVPIESDNVPNGSSDKTVTWKRRKNPTG